MGGFISAVVRGRAAAKGQMKCVQQLEFRDTESNNERKAVPTDFFSSSFFFFLNSNGFFVFQALDSYYYFVLWLFNILAVVMRGETVRDFLLFSLVSLV